MNTNQLVLQAVFAYLGERKFKCFWVPDTEREGTDFSEFRVRVYFGGVSEDFYVGLSDDGGDLMAWRSDVSRVSRDFMSKARAFVLADPGCFDQVVEFLSDE